MTVQTTSDKFSQEAIDIPAKIKKGKTRWNQCFEALEKIDPDLLQGPVLDFGCGVGYFVLEGLRRNMNIWGVDQFYGKILRYQKLLGYTKSPVNWSRQCLVGNGTTLPFSSESFDVVTSWWVFEHIADPGEAIREMVRVTRPGGVIVMRAQDAHTSWEGHLNIPWIPYLPGHLQRVWIEAFGKSPERRQGVWNITQNQVITLLNFLGCRTIIQAKPPRPLVDSSYQLSTKEDVLRLANKVKKEFESGERKPVQEGLYLYAQKISSNF